MRYELLKTVIILPFFAGIVLHFEAESHSQADILSLP